VREIVLSLRWHTQRVSLPGLRGSLRLNNVVSNAPSMTVSEPITLAGSGVLQRRFLGLPGKKGQVVCALLKLLVVCIVKPPYSSLWNRMEVYLCQISPRPFFSLMAMVTTEPTMPIDSNSPFRIVSFWKRKTGFELLVTLVPLAGRPSVAVLILTRKSVRGLRDLARANGAQELLVKQQTSGEELAQVILKAIAVVGPTHKDRQAS
jgi:hypothetical protein